MMMIMMIVMIIKGKDEEPFPVLLRESWGSAATKSSAWLLDGHCDKFADKLSSFFGAGGNPT